MGPTGLDLMQSSSARKKNRTLFFWGMAFEQKNKNRTKKNRALFSVPLGGSGRYTCPSRTTKTESVFSGAETVETHGVSNPDLHKRNA